MLFFRHKYDHYIRKEGKNFFEMFLKKLLYILKRRCCSEEHSNILFSVIRRNIGKIYIRRFIPNYNRILTSEINMNLPQWFKKGKEPDWFIEATKEWKDSTVRMPD